MHYEDELIVSLKKEQRRKKFTDIKSDGVYIEDRFINFTPRKIFDTVDIYIPDEFIDMPEEIQLMKYPSANKPQVILTSLDVSVNFAFNLIEDRIEEEQLKDLSAEMAKMIQKVNPAAMIYEEKSGRLSNGHLIYMFDYKSFGIDEQIYNMVCFTTINCGTLHSVFNCLDRDAEDWKEVAWQAFLSINEYVFNV